MSSDSTTPTGAPATGPTPAAGPLMTEDGPGRADVIASHPGADVPAGPGEDREPGWVTRHTTLLTTALVAVIVAALALTGLVLYRDAREDRNSETEAAFAASVEAQGATLETVECDGDTCAAVVSGQAYTVLVQEDADGEQHFGVSAFVGD
jgi:hypothetical protein